MNTLIIGNIGSGKTSIGGALAEKLDSMLIDIDGLRTEYSNGKFSGEFLAWSHFLQAVENAESDQKLVFEFTGTGKNAWFVREAMKLSMSKNKSRWLCVYLQCPREVCIERVSQKTYEIPIPYNFDDIRSSVNFIGGDLLKKHGSSYWGCPEIIVKSDGITIEESVNKIHERLEL
jgi:shikimate kinase